MSTIITKQSLFSGGSLALPIDRYDPALSLYFPLWYPHSDMTGSTIYSYDKNRHTGTVTGTVFGTQGRIMDGDDVISIPDTAVLDASTALTVMAWVKRGATGDTRYGIVNKILITGGQRSWALRFADLTNDAAQDKIIFQLSKDGAVLSNIESTSTYTSTSLFYHIAGTYLYVTDGTSVMNLYVNGVTAATELTNVVGPIFPSTANVGIGASYYSAGVWAGFFNGTIGDVLVYNRVLSSGEIVNHYAVTKWRYT
uniref:Putative lectin/glucanase superfamily protein n=1 Tax=viral metagenome TaxID=1070528 RepID=A0A6M3L6E4_9ZZZZ